MKKIILFIDNLGSGGAQRQMVNLSILLKQRGYGVKVLVYANAPFYQPLLEQNSIQVDLLQCTGVFDRIKKVRKYLHSANADIVIAFLETPGFLACLSKLGGTRWKLITNELSAKHSTFTDAKNRIYNWFERYSDAKVCNSYNAKRMWEQHYPQYLNKLHVIYNPVFSPNTLSEHERRRIDKLHITVAASYQELKNPLRVIEAVRRLSISEREHLVINWYGRAEVTSGDTKVYDEALRLVKLYDLAGVIQLNGETDRIYEHMLSSAFVGLFSTVEGLPNAICEGMMLGKPIIMSRVSDCEILTEGNGILCDPYSVESIYGAFVRLLHFSDEQLQIMGRCSKEKAEQLFSSNKIIEQWIELIEELTR